MTFPPPLPLSCRSHQARFLSVTPQSDDSNGVTDSSLSAREGRRGGGGGGGRGGEEEEGGEERRWEGFGGEATQMQIVCEKKGTSLLFSSCWRECQCSSLFSTTGTEARRMPTQGGEEAVKEGGREVWRKEEGQRVRKKEGGAPSGPQRSRSRAGEKRRSVARRGASRGC